MSRTIYLEGELGEIYGNSFKFVGDSVQEALKCIEANRPDFRKYFIDAHEKNIQFHIEVQGNEMESIEECLLPLKEGDIIITPVPAGSSQKSRGRNSLLAAFAILTLFVLSGGTSAALGPNPSALNKFLFTKGGALTTKGLVLASVGVNLGMTGLSLLMAPDPATDKEEPESYLFNGDERLVVEGDPVPVLYGELIVPGMPVSFELSNFDVTSVNELPSTSNSTTYADTFGDIQQDTEGMDAAITEAEANTGIA